MAHFAKLNRDGVVVFVTKAREDDDGQEAELSARTGDTYKQTSYNTRGGVHYDPETGEPSEDQSKAFRYNYAGIGYTFDESIGSDGAFIPPQDFPSWILNVETCLWEPPIPYPSDGGTYRWDEESGAWIVSEVAS